MKRTVFISFLYLMAGQAVAQNDFAQIGTIWKFYASGVSGDWYQQAESVKDTVIQNLLFKKVRVTVQRKTFCSTYPNCPLGNFYMNNFYRQSNDSLFEYRDGAQTYFFRYTLKAGDTLSFIDRYSFGTDTVRKYVIKRLTDTLLGGAKLRKWSLIQICKDRRSGDSYPFMEFIEGIGSMNNFISFESSYCYIDGTGYYLCGFDNKLVKHQITGCNLVSNKDLDDFGYLSISPNPAHEAISITSEQTPVEVIKIFDVQGSLIRHIKYTEGEKIDISGLHPGLYFIQVLDNKKNSVFKKLSKI